MHDGAASRTERAEAAPAGLHHGLRSHREEAVVWSALTMAPLEQQLSLCHCHVPAAVVATSLSRVQDSVS